MLPYKPFNLSISNHAVDRFSQRSTTGIIDEIKIRSTIRDYLQNVNESDIYETKEGTYYVKFYEDVLSTKKDDDFYFIISKDSTVMTFTKMRIEKLMEKIR
ncbi:MAG: hypothetical protein HRS57_01390 [Mycoplasmataceae bacterium]|nr:hypothetical protein [Mycoplasmataceae bacterium]